jgi:hypothetical protein
VGSRGYIEKPPFAEDDKIRSRGASLTHGMRRLSPPFIGRIVLALALFVGAFAFVEWWDFVPPSVGGARYQAVFLSNGQTYFGHYVDRLGPYAKIENAFYIQQTPAANENEAPTSKIVRRGSEFHNPEPFVLLPKTAILFVEDLRADSSVAQFMERELGR